MGFTGFAVVTLILISHEISAHPYRISLELQSPSSYQEDSSRTTVEDATNATSSSRRSLRSPQDGAPEDPSLIEQPGRNPASRRTTPSDEVSRLVDRAVKDGELLDPEAWSAKENHRGRSRNVQRDTSRHEDFYSLHVPLQTTMRPPFEQEDEEERIYGFRQDPMMESSMQADGKFVFPTDDEVGRHPGQKVTQDRPPACRGSTFCERVPHYPEDIVNAAIRRNTSLKYLAGVDVVSDIVQRIDVTDDTPLCVSTEQVVYPKSAENKQKEWLFVVNQDNFKQGVRIETCNNENSDCSVVDGLAEGYRTTCKQKYIYRQLAAVTSDGTVNPEMFRFPSSCCCHAKFTGNPLTRMGISLGSQRSQTSATRRRRRK